MVSKLKNQGFNVKSQKATDEELLELWEEHQDLEEVTVQAGYEASSESWIRKRLKNIGVTFGKSKKFNVRHSDEELKHLYEKYGDLEKVVEETTYSSSPGYIKQRLKDAGVSLEDDTRVSEEKLAHLYYVKGLSLEEILADYTASEYSKEELKDVLNIDDGEELFLRAQNSKKVGEFDSSLFSISEKAIVENTELDFEELKAEVLAEKDSLVVHFFN